MSLKIVILALFVTSAFTAVSMPEDQPILGNDLIDCVNGVKTVISDIKENAKDHFAIDGVIKTGNEAINVAKICYSSLHNTLSVACAAALRKFTETAKSEAASLREDHTRRDILTDINNLLKDANNVISACRE